MPKDIKRKGIRVSMNAVTHKLESVVLDDVERAFERCRNHIESCMCAFDTSDNAKSHRLAEKLAEWLAKKQPHTDGEPGEAGTSLDRAEAEQQQTGE